jgi:hypothetical protein
LTTTTPPPHEIHDHRLTKLAGFLRESEKILDAWDAYSDQHTDLDGWPHDEHAYGLRAARRDADTWRAFHRIRPFAKELIATAEVQLQHLPPGAIQMRWPWQLATADAALDLLAALERVWLDTLDALPPFAKPGTEAYDDAVAERNAEAWHYLNELALHGQAMLDIHATVQRTTPHLEALAPAPAPALPASAAPVARR